MCINTNRLVDNSDLAKAIIDNLTCNICLGIFCLDSLVVRFILYFNPYLKASSNKYVKYSKRILKGMFFVKIV